MQAVLEKEKVTLFYFLTDALMSAQQYENILEKAMAMPDCPVVPFFGSFMREIRNIMKETPSSIVLTDQDGKVLSEVSKITVSAHLLSYLYTDFERLVSINFFFFLTLPKLYNIQHNCFEP